MEKKWKNPQSIIVIAIIAIIFCYIFVDLFLNKPQMNNDIKELKSQYNELSIFLDKKIPEIDSTFSIQSKQLQEQKQQMDSLELTLSHKIR